MKYTSKENIHVLNYVLLNVTTGDRKREVTLSTELLQIPWGNGFLEQLLLNPANISLFFFFLTMRR